MKPRHRRFAWIGAGLLVLGIAAALVLKAFQRNLVFFYTPSQVIAHEAPDAQLGRTFRIGSLQVLAEHVPHDAPQVAVRVASADHALGYATDVGRSTDRLLA